MARYTFEKGNKLAYKHGECSNLGQSKLYRCWSGMIQRTTNKKHKHYKYYGGRGITVCDEWLVPDSFFKWAKLNGYKDELQIDRINNDGNYEPSNCRFVTSFVNIHNRKLRDDWGLSKRGNSYQVIVTYNHKTYRPGSSTDKQKAILLRNQLLSKICGYSAETP